MKVWDAKARICVATLAGHQDGITSLALNENGAVGLSTGLDRTIYVWDAMGGRRVGELPADTEVPAAGLSGDARWVVTGSFLDDRVRFWKLSWS